MTVTWKPVWYEIGDDTIRGDDPYSVIDPLWWEVDFYSTVQRLEKTSERFSRPQTYVHAICWYESEVNNGGHHQFLWNSTGILWARAIAGFKTAGMSDYEQILLDCVKRMGGDIPFEREKRQEILDVINDDFDDLDDRYYALSNAEKEPRIMRYIRDNDAAFKWSGFVQKPV